MSLVKRMKLVSTDSANSVLIASDSRYRYTPFGTQREHLITHLGYGEYVFEPSIEGYATGDGVRFYIPQYYRFSQPDLYSPFGYSEGALLINSYCYCIADPMNRRDPDGHSPLGIVKNWFRTRKRYLNKIGKKLQPDNTLSTASIPYPGAQTNEGSWTNLMQWWDRTMPSSMRPAERRKIQRQLPEIFPFDLSYLEHKEKVVKDAIETFEQVKAFDRKMVNFQGTELPLKDNFAKTILPTKIQLRRLAQEKARLSIMLPVYRGW